LVTFSKSEIIKVPAVEVYNLLSDFEKAPQRSSFWKSVKLLKREGNSGTYETVAEFEGRKFSSVTRVTNEPGQASETEIIEGEGKGSKMNLTISSVPEGTQVTVQGEIVLAGWAQMLSGTAGSMLGGIVEGRIESGIAKDEMERIRKALEH
jgi:uncharacterized membrane protein